MTHVESFREVHPRRRWTRCNARLFMRPDADRYLRPEYRGHHTQPAYGLKYDPNQPRVPAGNPDGGQWTGEGGGGLTDVSGSRRRPPTSIFVNGRWLQATPAQQARFEVASARARDAMRLVRERDPNWRLQPSAYGTGIESEIRRAEDIAAEALARVSYLQNVGIGPGPFAGESIPARGPERNFTAAERREANRIWNGTGCHTCGTFDPGTKSGNPVLDHQMPNALNALGRTQRLFPQCATCSSIQGGWLSYWGSKIK